MDISEHTRTANAATQGTERITSLNSLPYGTTARVLNVSGNDAVARRLMEMGIVPGVQVCVVKAAPLGDPIQIRLRGYHLALRRNEAQTITVVMSDK